MSAATYDDERPTSREIQGAIDAVDAMVEIVDGFEAYVVHTAVGSEHATRYRLNLLWIHALSALFMAPLIAATGRSGLTGPSFGFIRTIPGSPVSIAAVLGVGGLVLGLGCVFRAKRIEIVGLAGLGLFYLSFAISLAVPPLQWLFGDATIKPPLWGPVVYTHLAIIMVLHIYGLIIKIRDDRARKTLAERGT